jgi:hypothetical protein
MAEGEFVSVGSRKLRILRVEKEEKKLFTTETGGTEKSQDFGVGLRFFRSSFPGQLRKKKKNEATRPPLALGNPAGML